MLNIRGDRFGTVPVLRNAPLPLQREAALLMAEQGFGLREITARLSTTMVEAARLLAPLPWRFDLPETPEPSAPNHMECRPGFKGGFDLRAPGDRAVLRAVHSATMDREWTELHDRDFPSVRLRRAVRRLEDNGFLRRHPDAAGKQVALTPWGEAAAVLIKSRSREDA